MSDIMSTVLNKVAGQSSVMRGPAVVVLKPAVARGSGAAVES